MTHHVSCMIALVAPTSIIGVAMGLATAALWAISPILFASAGRRIGPFPVLLLRSALASGLLVLLLAASAALGGVPLRSPIAAQWIWLIISGFFGMVLGDGLCYQAFVTLGPRMTTQVLTTTPIGAALLAWAWLGEAFDLRTLAGIAVVMAAVFWAVYTDTRPERQNRDPGKVSAKGVIIALAGSLCIGVGAVTARYAYALAPMDTLIATTIRVASAAAILWLWPICSGRAGAIAAHLKHPFIRARVMAGTLAGPFVGMLTYMAALKCIEAGLVSTLASMSPLFILPIVAMWYRSRIHAATVLAAVVAIAGVWLICVR